MTSLSHKTTIGVFWNSLQKLASRCITVSVTLFLALFLTPEDFGLVAMMAVFITIANAIMDSGFRQALIQMKSASQIDFNSAFFANVVLSLLSYLILFLCAPLIASFYEQPILVNLIRVAALSVIINSFQVVLIAKLSREINFKLQFKAVLPASIISALVAVLMAYFGYGVWALVAQMLASSFFITLFLSLKGTWWPGLDFSLTSLCSMYNFGYKLFLSALIDTLFKNLYVIIIAKLFSASVAGLYFFADRIREIVIFQLVLSVQNVTFPALATLQDDKARLKLGFRNVNIVTTFILFPVIFFVAALAEPVFHLLLPEKWWLAAMYLQLMCLAGLLIPLHALNLNILQVKGRSDLFLRLEIIKKTILVVILFISFRFGVEGILIGQIVNSFLVMIPNSYFSELLIGYSAREQIRDIIPSLLLSALIGAVLYLTQEFFEVSNLLTLFFIGSIGLILYVILAIAFRVDAYSLVVSLIKSKLGEAR